MDLDRLAQSFRDFADTECRNLPLYDRLSRALVDEWNVLRLLAGAKGGQWRPVLLFAAVHDLVLQYPADDLAQWYPTVGGVRTVDDGDLIGAFRQFVEDHRDALVESLSTRSTQTNEVNRSCAWFVAARAATADLLDQPIALVELGASAGLNLRFDHYGYQFGTGRRYGLRSSNVHLATELQGVPPVDRELPPVVQRVGVDLDPVDVNDLDGRRWLKACIWPEQPERHARFDAALAEFVEDPVTIEWGDAIDDVERVVEQCPRDAHVIVFHSWMLTYVERGRRAQLAERLAEIGRARELTWLSAEAAGVVPGVDPPTEALDTVLAMSRWRDGQRHDEVLGSCQAHLKRLHWRGNAPEIG